MASNKMINRTAFVLTALLSVNVVMANTVTVFADEPDSFDVAAVTTVETSEETSQVCIDDSADQLYLALTAAETAAAESAYTQAVTETRVVQVSQSRAFKSYEGYRALTRDVQKQLQDMAVTDANGFRVLNGRYLVATGNGFGMSVGQNFDLTLANGTVIPCTLGDIKQNCHTDASNIFSPSGCCSEFIVDSSLLPDSVKSSGNCSKLCSEWDSVVVSVTIYSM